MSRFGIPEVIIGAALSMAPTMATAQPKLSPVEAAASAPATQKAKAPSAQGVGVGADDIKLTAVGEGVVPTKATGPEAKQKLSPGEEADQRDVCADAGKIINEAIFRALNDDPKVKGVLRYFAEAAQAITEKQCLKDKGLKAGK